jgi:glycosyltransferase involved in cell wall biosynthesis
LDGFATRAPERIDRADGGFAVHVVLDLSRLLLSVRRPVPSGIDRVEMAYAEAYLARPATACSFVVQSVWGWFAAVPRDQVAAFVGALSRCWQSGPAAAGDALSRALRIALRIQAGLALGTGRVALDRILARHPRTAFLLVSHRALDREAPIARLRRAGAAFVPLVHDLIPLSHPEYARPAQVGRHARRLATTAALADGILVNSATTAAVLRDYLPALQAPIGIAPLGVDALAAALPGAGAAPPGEAGAAPASDPYFVCLGTIEPRKNHLLLLHLWRALAEAGGRVPRLVIVGRRGWENENILDLLDRCPALRGVVEERGPLPDAEVAPLIAGASALLFPSFAEGFGLPVAEALGAGVPVICSDIPAMREVAGGVAEMIDPMDGPAWRAAILDYASAGSPRRAAQRERMRSWCAPTWRAHFAVVDEVLEQAVAARQAIARPGPARPARPAPSRPALPAPPRPAISAPPRPAMPTPPRPALPTPPRPARPAPPRPLPAPAGALGLTAAPASAGTLLVADSSSA